MIHACNVRNDSNSRFAWFNRGAVIQLQENTIVKKRYLTRVQ